MSENKMEHPFSGLRAEQMAAVTCTSPLVVVQAGAGTGKTHTLAARFAHLVASDMECSSHNVLTLTFTEKAAREMRDRIGRVLLGLRDYERARGNTPCAEHLDQAIKRLDDGYISTIHSFASRVIKESGLALDMDSGSVIIPPPLEAAFFSRMEEAFDKFDWQWFRTNSDEWNDRLDEALPLAEELVNMVSPAALSLAVRECSSLHGSMGRTPDMLYCRTGMEPGRAVEALIAALLPVAHDIRAQWEQARGLASGDQTSLGRDIGDFEKQCSGLSDMEYVCALFEGPISKLKGGKNKLRDAIGDILGMKLSQWRDSHRPDVELMGIGVEYRASGIMPEDDTVNLLCRVCAIGWHLWDEYRATRGVMSFDDLVRYASAAVERNPSYRTRFRHIMVDEFQDTDGIQDRFVQSIWDNGQGDGYVRSLFVVGDLKQSIYRFRHADLSIMDGYIRRASGGDGRLINLDCSYRMTGEVMDFINHMFGEKWRTGLGSGITRPYEPLRCPDDAPWWQNRCAVTIHPVVRISAPKEEEEKKERVSEVRKRRYTALGAWIDDTVRRGVLVWDKDERSLREVRYSDVAVLVPSRSDYPLIADAMAGLPLSFSASMDFFTRCEIQDVSNFLSAAANPDDRMSMYGYLSSPISMIPLYPTEEDVERAVARLMELRSVALTAGPAAALSRLMDSPEWISAYGAQVRVSGNMLAAIALCREYEASMGGSLWGAASYLKSAMGSRTEEPDLLDGYDAVRIQTAHSAKGLEYPIVAALRVDEDASPGYRQNSRISPSRIFGAVPSGTLFESGKSAVRAIDKYMEESAHEEEWQRLMYVAFTRARDCLVLAGADDAMSASCDISDMADVSDVSVTSDGILGIDAVDELLTDNRYYPDKNIKLNTDNINIIINNSISCSGIRFMSASAYAAWSYCPWFYRMRYALGMYIPWGKEGTQPGGAKLGSLAHWVLARWDGTTSSLEKWLGQGAQNMMPPDLRAACMEPRGILSVRQWIESFTGSSEGAEYLRVVRAGIASREAAFRVPMDGVTLVGAVDIVWTEGGVVFLRDYKTTQSMESSEEMYRAQLCFYGMAAHLAFGGVSVDMALWPLRETHEAVRIEEPRWDDMRESILEAARGMAHGPFPVKLEKCPSCPWLGHCAANIP